MRDIVEKSARHLYGLIHARFIITTHGLTKMVRSASIPRHWTSSGISGLHFFFLTWLLCTWANTRPFSNINNSSKSSRSATLDDAQEFSATATLSCLWLSLISLTPNLSSYSVAAVKTFTTPNRLVMHRSTAPISDAVSPICSSKSTLNWYPPRVPIVMCPGFSDSNCMM